MDSLNSQLKAFHLKSPRAKAPNSQYSRFPSQLNIPKSARGKRVNMEEIYRTAIDKYKTDQVLSVRAKTRNGSRPRTFRRNLDILSETESATVYERLYHRPSDSVLPHKPGDYQQSKNYLPEWMNNIQKPKRMQKLSRGSKRLKGSPFRTRVRCVSRQELKGKRTKIYTDSV